MSPPPERAPAKVVPLIIPPSAATATAPLSPAAAAAVVPLVPPGAQPPQTYTPTADDLCAVIVGRLDPGTELAQMASAEWQGEFQDFLYQSLANDTGAKFFGCVLVALQSRGVDPKQAMAILAPLSQKVSADYFAAHPEQAPPPPPGQAPSAQPTVATPPAPDPGAPQLIPTDPLVPYAPPGAMVPSGPGGVILAASDDGISQKQWGMIAIAVLVVGGAAYYYARR
jgi:hypothetical protein